MSQAPHLRAPVLVSLWWGSITHEVQCLLTTVFTCLVFAFSFPVLTVAILHIFWAYYLVSDVCHSDLFSVGLEWVLHSLYDAF